MRKPVLVDLKTRHHFFKSGNEPVQGELIEFAGISGVAVDCCDQLREFLLQIASLETHEAIVFHCPEVFCRCFKLLVIEQLAYEVLTRVNVVALIVFIITRQQQSCFDPHQRSSYQNELTRQFNIHRLHLIHVVKEIVGDAGNRDIVNVEFVPFNEKEQQIEGAFELW